jgi:tetratricopeptide (TPR) repeat protein
VRKWGLFRQRQILLAILLFMLACTFSASCRSKIVRVPVPEEDVIKANQIAQEGDIAFGSKDYYAALIKYLEAARLNPYNEYLLNRLGLAYSQLKFFNEAGEAFRRAIDLNPKFPYAFNNLGSVYFAQQNLGEAEKYFKTSIHLKGDEASFYMNLGSLYLERKKPQKAMAAWRKALTIDPYIFSKSSAVSLASGGRSSPMEKSYFVARLYASEGNVEFAINSLKLAFTQGFSDIEAIDTQPDFNPIRKDARFIEFMKNLSLLIKLRSKVGLQGDTPVTKPFP